jgi:gliding motility-associated lipoprotein GldH
LSGFVTLITLAGCDSGILISEKWEWDNHQWVAGDAKSITLHAADTTATYSMELSLEHQRSYGFRNMYIRTLTTFPSGKVVTSVTSLELTNAKGGWAGDCGRKVCSIDLPLQNRFTFPETGTYVWTIEPYMRMDTVYGISNLTVTCRKLSL